MSTMVNFLVTCLLFYINLITSDYFSGGYYKVELAGRRLRLISLNMNIYLEDIADEFSYHERSSQGLLRSRHQQKGSDHRLRHNDQTRAPMKHSKSEDTMTPMQSNPTSSWVSDPEEQWEWLHREMDEARQKDQNVRKYNRIVYYYV